MFIKVLCIRMRDFSAFTCPFTESPIIVGRASSGFYIPTPTAIRNYLPYPDVGILKQMKLPYPFRVKEPVFQRLERLESDSSFKNIVNSQHSNSQRPRRKKSSRASEYSRSSFIQSNQPIITTKRHSLDLGQVDHLLRQEDTSLLIPIKANHPVRSKSIISNRTVEEIMSWVPDKNTVWQDDTSTASSNKLSPPATTSASKKDPNRIPPAIWQVNNSNSIDYQLHPLDVIKK